jgi:hypothetical protein
MPRKIKDTKKKPKAFTKPSRDKTPVAIDISDRPEGWGECPEKQVMITADVVGGVYNDKVAFRTENPSQKTELTKLHLDGEQVLIEQNPNYKHKVFDIVPKCVQKFGLFKPPEKYNPENKLPPGYVFIKLNNGIYFPMLARRVYFWPWLKYQLSQLRKIFTWRKNAK